MFCIRIKQYAFVFAIAAFSVQASLGDDTGIEFFEKKVRPILVENCFKCHSSTKQKGGLRLDSREFALKGGESGPAVVPGQTSKGELIAAIKYDADGYQMPPSGKLKPDEIAALTEWVKIGAPWPDMPDVKASNSPSGGIDLVERAKHWSFQPVEKQPVPKVENSIWPRNPIDNFILAKIEAAGLSPSSPAEKRTLLRRVTFDLVGLPPTSEEIEAFLNDRSSTAYEKVVERLLGSPRYGERWARHWLDLVRFSETSGHEFDFQIRHAWPYRDYVIRAFNADVPYNQFVIEHIAGDLVKTPRRHPNTHTNESVIGTAFYWFAQGKHSPVDIRAEECELFDNQIDVLSKTFLGLTVACARCHDHKFDPITTKDYYALAGYLQSSRMQYAILDPPENTKSIVDQITKLKKANSKALVSQSANFLKSRFSHLAETLLLVRDELAKPNKKEKTKPVKGEKAADAGGYITQWKKYVQTNSARNIANLFHPWVALSKVPAGRSFHQRREALVNQLRNQQKSSNQQSADATIYSDFDNDSFSNWVVSGDAFGARTTEGGELILQPSASQPIQQLAESSVAHSGLISGQLQGAIRSHTFPIEKKYIWYRMRREGGKPNPGQKLKNGQVHLIIDGFQFIRNPLYGQLTINIPAGKEFTWFRHDLGKFQGHKAYIEIEDADDGFIVVDRILFSNEGPRPDSPSSLIVKMLDDPTITSAEELANRYQKLFSEMAERWADHPSEFVSENDDHLQLLNWMLKNRLPTSEQPASPKQNANIQPIVKAFESLDESINPPTLSLATVDGSGENEHVLIRGNHKKPGELVERRFLEVMGGANHQSTEKGSGRYELALQITDPTNPFPSRVIVNRLWQHHFGRGIVPTPDNFGVLGQPPSHPKLLDFLAGELVQQNWSLKQMHRLMVSSNTYRMSSVPNPDAKDLDPDNRLWHRMPVQRLEGEIIRDAILAISGRLNSSMYGKSVLPFLTPFMEGRGRPRSGPLDGFGRRSIYMNVRRNFLMPMFLAFDMPTPLSTMGRRSSSNVPAQALTMMNNPFVVLQAKVWADRTLAGPAKTTEARVNQLYVMAFGRPATQEEKEAAVDFLKGQGEEYNGVNDPRTWADFCHVLLNVKEFIFVN